MDEGPYRGYHGAGEFDTVKMEAPIRGAAPSPVTSAFDRPPVRGPSQAPYMTSNFDEPPVRMGPMHASSPPVTGEFDMPPVRTPSPAGGAGQFSPTAPLAQPPSAAAARTADVGKSNAFSGSWRGLSQAWVLADVILRVLTLLILVIAVGLLPGFLSKLDDLNYTYGTTFSTASPKYEVALAAVGILYSACGIVFSCIRYFTGKLILGTYSHLVLYICDQIFVCLYLTAGSAGASHLITIGCTDTKTCGNGAGAVAMLFFAFALSFGNLILSSISFYKRKA